MDWLRRNWPDLLIGVALIAVIAGIIATLISGGSFFPAGNRTVENPATTTAPLTDSASPSSTNEPSSAQGGDLASAADSAAAAQDAGESSLSSSLEGGQADPAADSAAASEDNDDSTDTADSGPAAGSSAAASQPTGGDDALPVAVLPPGQAGDDAASAASSGAETSQPTSSSLTSTPASSSAAAATQTTVPETTIVSPSDQPDAPFRVSVGAFANRENAERQAEAFAAAGYPVFIGVQGNLNIVLVGPYDSEAEARAVADRIQGSDMGVSQPTVYEFTPDEAAQAASAAAASTTSSVASSVSSSSSSAPASSAQTVSASGDDTVISTAPAEATGVRYLQAGAYATRESSLPQRERLEGLGFVVSERLESDLVKLLIGPFDATNLQNAQSRLEAAGIESFPR